MNESPIDLVSAARRIYPPRRSRKGDSLGNFFNKVCFGNSECWLWYGHIDDLGYGRTSEPELKAHRLAWRLFHGPIPQGMCVCHKCDVRNCVNPDHLFLGTQKDNVQDMIRKGRKSPNGAKGELNAMSVLTNERVVELRKMRSETGLSYKKLARLFGISTMTAHRACVGQSWTHL